MSVMELRITISTEETQPFRGAQRSESRGGAGVELMNARNLQHPCWSQPTRASAGGRRATGAEVIRWFGSDSLNRGTEVRIGMVLG
jgi:hypothetical protein